MIRSGTQYREVKLAWVLRASKTLSESIFALLSNENPLKGFQKGVFLKLNWLQHKERNEMEAHQEEELSRAAEVMENPCSCLSPLRI